MAPGASRPQRPDERLSKQIAHERNSYDRRNCRHRTCQIGQAIARRVGVGKHVLLADMRQDNANAATEVLDNAGYEVSVATVDAS